MFITEKLLRVMRLTALFLLIGCLSVSAAATGQQQITLKKTDATMAQVLRDLEKQSGKQFVYFDQDLALAHKITIDLKNMTLEQALAAIFKNQPLTYSVYEKNVVIKKISAPAAVEIVAPPSSVHGRITNEKGEPVAGVSISIKGGKVIGVTNDNGEFILNNVPDGATLVFSAVSIERMEAKLNGRTELALSARTSTNELDELQVIAYGKVSKRLNVGSVTTVKGNDIEKQPVGNPLAALEGMVPGLTVSQSSGLPGSSVQLQIRGQNSIKATSSSAALLPLDNPLFIVDGVPFAAQNANLNQLTSMISPGTSTLYGNPYGGISPFNSINPADIETIEVLRDADATAIYGSRGANGVILITTKKGKTGKTTVNANVRTGASQATRLPRMLNTQQYLAMRREAFKNDNATPALNTNGYDLLAYDTTVYTDWQKYFFGRTAHTTDANVSVSGGDASTQFLLGAGYHRETYLVPGDYADNRASVNMNLHHRSPNQRLSLDFSVNYSYDKNNASSALLSLKSFSLVPDYPALQDANGNLNWYYNGTPLYFNPAQYFKQTYWGKLSNLIGHLQAGYVLLPGLNVIASIGYNTSSYNEHSETPRSAIHPALTGSANANFGSNTFQTWIIEPQLEYAKTVLGGKLHALLGMTLQQNSRNSTNVSAINYTNDALLGSISGAPAGSVTTTDGYAQYKYSALFARLGYVWADRYILSVNARRDGSSRFGPGRQFGNFASVAGGWIFSEEPFIKMNPGILSYGKIHVSYGTTGNDAVGDYQYQMNWKPTSLAYQGQIGYSPQNLYEPDFSWTVNKKLEAGIDFNLLNDRIHAGATWYRNRSSNQLIFYSLPIQTGFNGVTTNFSALIENAGWELQLASTNVKTQRFTWTSNVNLTIPSNKLVEFPGLATSSYAGLYVVGQPISVLNKFKFAGINDTTGLFQYYTAKGTISSSPSANPTALGGDLQPIGNLDPKFYGGLRNSFSYKGFQLDIFLQFVKQMGTNYMQQIYSNGIPGAAVNQPVTILSHWQKTGDAASVVFQKLSQNSSTQTAAAAFINSDAAYSDASYIRCKTISLSYGLPEIFLRKAKISSCRLYLTAANLFTISKYEGDPETRSYFGVPPLKTIVAGIQLGL